MGMFLLQSTLLHAASNEIELCLALRSKYMMHHESLQENLFTGATWTFTIYLGSSHYVLGIEPSTKWKCLSVDAPPVSCPPSQYSCPTVRPWERWITDIQTHTHMGPISYPRPLMREGIKKQLRQKIRGCLLHWPIANCVHDSSTYNIPIILWQNDKKANENIQYLGLTLAVISNTGDVTINLPVPASFSTLKH